MNNVLLTGHLFVVSEDDLVTLEEIIPGLLSMIRREDQTLQVTYNGKPMYFF